MSINPFRNVTRDIIDGKDGSFQSTSGFIVRSAGSDPIIIDQLYADAFAIAYDHTTSNEGIASLLLDLNAGADEPRLFPKVAAGADGLALGRIIWNAGEGEQVQRISKAEGSYRNWTVANTRVVSGKAFKKTRKVFLDEVEHIAERLRGNGAAARAEVELAFDTADALVRQGSSSGVQVQAEVI
jgi:hypothetical protein